MFRKLKEEIDSIMDRDPAARSRLEVYFLYSGFKAVRAYRKANWCFRHNLKFLARYISQRSRAKQAERKSQKSRTASVRKEQGPECLEAGWWRVGLDIKSNKAKPNQNKSPRLAGRQGEG